MSGNIQKLQTLRFESMNQFLEALNQNFAIVENSPLYKGIPGNPGNPGDDGLRGTRGIKFFFLDLVKFQEQFPNELSLASDITLNFLNSKVTNFETKQKLLNALDTDELVDKDIIVMYNSAMVSFSFSLETFVNTGQSFNPVNTAAENINEIIDKYVREYIENNPVINSLENNVSKYSTYAKNYADNNSGFITNELLNSSVYSPYIPGFNNRVGIEIPEHKYYGYADNNFGLADKGSMVFGSMRRYYQLMMATISTSSDETLTSDYAPGVDNIPSLVMLQDTYNNGLYFGYKGRANLKRFGSIYKNENNDVVIKSDSSKIASEYSMLLLNRQYMKFDKLVQFGDSLEVSRNLSVFSDINNKHLRTGKYTTGANQNNNYNNEKVEVGSRSVGSIVLNTAEFEEYTNYLNRVLITDINGRVSKEYALETLPLNQDEVLNLTQISTPFPTSNKNVLTSNYFGFLASKFNSQNAYITANYWRKNQFNTGEIPALHLSSSLNVDKYLNISNIFNADVQLNRITMGADLISNSKKMQYNNFKSTVFVTDENGLMLNSYGILKEAVDGTNQLNTVLTTPELKIVTADYLNKLINFVNLTRQRLDDNYWTKTEFGTGIIPALVLDNKLNIGKQNSQTTDILVRNVNGTIFSISRAAADTLSKIKIGHNSNLDIESETIKFTKHMNNVLVTGADGLVSKNYHLFSPMFTVTNRLINTDGGGYNDFEINPDIVATNNNKEYGMPTYKTIDSLVSIFRSFKTWLGNNYWRKDQWKSGEIPQLVLSNRLDVRGDMTVGPVDSPVLDIASNNITIGKEGGQTRFKNNDIYFTDRKTQLIGTDNNGKVIKYTPYNTLPTSSDPVQNTGDMGNDVRANFYTKGRTQNYQGYTTNPNDIIGGNIFHWLIAHLYAIRTMLYDRPTFAEMNSIHIPLGSIIFRATNDINEEASGWYLCNGRVINNRFLSNYRLPDYNDSFPKFRTSASSAASGGTNNLYLSIGQLPPHDHFQHSDINGDKGQAELARVGITLRKDLGKNNWSRSGSNADGWIYTTSKTGSGQAINNQPNFNAFYPYIKLH